MIPFLRIYVTTFFNFALPILLLPDSCQLVWAKSPIIPVVSLITALCASLMLTSPLGREGGVKQGKENDQGGRTKDEKKQKASV